MAAAKLPPEKPRKFEVVYKDDDGTESIWKYDLDKFPNGPISTETKYPAGYMKELKQKQKLAKLEKKQSILEKAKAANEVKKG
jgi:hypothetical protein